MNAVSPCIPIAGGTGGFENIPIQFRSFCEVLIPHHNSICLLFDEHIVRLVGAAHDGARHFYRVIDTNGETRLAPATGTCLPLRDYLPAEQLLRMDERFRAREKHPPCNSFEISLLSGVPEDQKLLLP